VFDAAGLDPGTENVVENRFAERGRLLAASPSLLSEIRVEVTGRTTGRR
jgi:hypothetical protein